MALRRSGYRCERCGVKQSKAKGNVVVIDVHHKRPIGRWMDIIITLIVKFILTNPDNLECICHKCHEDEHNGRVEA